MIGLADIPSLGAIEKKMVQNVLEKRVSHTQLFYSADGAGALPTAVLFAQLLLCKNLTQNGACKTCDSCIQVSSLNHADLHFLLPNTVTKKEEENNAVPYQKTFRELFCRNPFLTIPDWRSVQTSQTKAFEIKKEEAKRFFTKLNLKSHGGGNRIGIIWMPETMNNTSSNMLLKLLEEPPEKTYFVLVSDKPDEIIATIISRAQILKLPKPSTEQISTLVKEKLGVTAQQAEVLANGSAGSLGRALYLFAEFKDGDQLFADFRDWMRLCFVKNISGLNSWIEKYSRENGREKIIQLMSYALGVFRRVLHWQYRQSMAGIINVEEKNFIENFSPFVNERNILDYVDVYNKAIEDMQWNGNAKIIMTDLTYKVMVLLKK